MKFTWDSTFVDALGPRDAIEIKPKSNTGECSKDLHLEAVLLRTNTSYACVEPERLFRGGPTLTAFLFFILFFFSLMGDERIKMILGQVWYLTVSIPGLCTLT